MGGTGIEAEHCRFELQPDGEVGVVPLSEKAMPNIKINGVKIADMSGIRLRPNDRICLGPSSMFLFKHMAKAGDASRPDPEDDPITYDVALDEVNAEDSRESRAA